MKREVCELECWMAKKRKHDLADVDSVLVKPRLKSIFQEFYPTVLCELVYPSGAEYILRSYVRPGVGTNIYPGEISS